MDEQNTNPTPGATPGAAPTPGQPTPTPTPNAGAGTPGAQPNAFRAPSPAEAPQTPPANPTTPPATPGGDLSSVAPDGAAPTPGTPGVFDASEPAFTPDAGAAGDGTTPTATTPAPTGKKSHMMLWIIAVVVLIVVFVLGYFFVLPLFTGGDDAPEQTTETTETPERPEPTTPEEPAVTAPSYESLFVASPPARETAMLSGEVTYDAVRAALVAQAEGAGEGVTEVVLSTGESPVPGAALFSLLGADGAALPSDAAAVFTGRSTTYIYKDANGAWPGYVFEVSPEALAAGTVRSEIASFIEMSGTKFFIVEAGDMAAFADGEVFGVADRYAPGTTAGASLGYLIEGNRILISTSFEGMKEGMKLLSLGTIPTE